MKVTKTKTENRMEQIGAIVAAGFMLIGCFVVVRPFTSALMWAGILCFITWPLYSLIVRRLGGRRTLAASLMTLIVALLVVIPVGILGISLGDSIRKMPGYISTFLHDGPPPPPSWVAKLPFVGPMVDSYWSEMVHNSDKSQAVVKEVMMRSKEWLFARSVDLGQAILQICLSLFIAFFFYRDGISVMARLKDATHRIAGDRTHHLLTVVAGTVKGVVYGILGTAVAQGVLAGIGFWIAGVPMAVLLGVATFFFSLVPMGPPLVWIPATVWLFYNGSAPWAIFMAIWGTFVVSGVDNVLKPYLISRGSNLPFVLVFLGVLGGVLAFGIIGVFLGPTLLAVGFALLKEWSAGKSKDEHA